MRWSVVLLFLAFGFLLLAAVEIFVYKQELSYTWIMFGTAALFASVYWRKFKDAPKADDSPTNTGNKKNRARKK